MTFSISSGLAALVIHLLALFSAVSARPSDWKILQINPRQTTADLSSYTVPLSDGTQSLPPPNSTLKALTLGRGTQNYTCDATTSTPVAVGAIASLLDVSPLLAFLPPAAGLDLLELIPRYLLDFDLPTITSGTIPILGHHYFNAAGQPTFDLGSTGFLTGKKVGDIPAPSNASIGQFDQGFGAVDWLALGDAGCSVILSEAYRVETAGGKAPSSCTGQAGNIEVQYAALYWFYQE